MAGSNRLRLSEVRQALRLVGECRDLGSNCRGWFTHLLRGVQQLLPSNIVLGGMAPAQGFHLYNQAPLIVSVGWENARQEETALNYLAQEAQLTDPAFQHFRSLSNQNITLRPLRLVSRKVIEASEYHVVRKSLGMEDMLFSQRETVSRRATFVISPQRAPRDNSFSARNSKLLRLLHNELALLVGKVLSDGEDDPLVNLSPRVRQTLTLLLQGDSEKQAAVRMGISRHTVHEYVMALYKHFRVSSRAELLALCWQRGLGVP